MGNIREVDLIYHLNKIMFASDRLFAIELLVYFLANMLLIINPLFLEILTLGIIL